MLEQWHTRRGSLMLLLRYQTFPNLPACNELFEFSHFSYLLVSSYIQSRKNLEEEVMVLRNTVMDQDRLLQDARARSDMLKEELTASATKVGMEENSTLPRSGKY